MPQIQLWDLLRGGVLCPPPPSPSSCSEAQQHQAQENSEEGQGETWNILSLGWGPLMKKDSGYNIKKCIQCSENFGYHKNLLENCPKIFRERGANKQEPVTYVL